MKPDAVQVAVDILRELGHEDVARWVEHPDAVRELLLHDPLMHEPGIERPVCPRCDAEREWHGRRCLVAAAWRALGDPRGLADIERAHEEALQEQRTRTEPPFTGGCVGREGARVYATPGAIFEPVRVSPFGVTQYRYVPMHRTPPVQSVAEGLARIAALDSRESSDARGVDAVEAEARMVHRLARDLPFNTQGEPIPFMRHE